MLKEREELKFSKPKILKRFVCLILGHQFKKGMVWQHRTNFNICTRCHSDVPFYPTLRGYSYDYAKLQWVKKWRSEKFGLLK